MSHSTADGTSQRSAENTTADARRADVPRVGAGYASLRSALDSAVLSLLTNPGEARPAAAHVDSAGHTGSPGVSNLHRDETRDSADDTQDDVLEFEGEDVEDTEEATGAEDEADADVADGASEGASPSTRSSKASVPALPPSTGSGSGRRSSVAATEKKQARSTNSSKSRKGSSSSAPSSQIVTAEDLMDQIEVEVKTDAVTALPSIEVYPSARQTPSEKTIDEMKAKGDEPIAIVDYVIFRGTKNVHAVGVVVRPASGDYYVVYLNERAYRRKYGEKAYFCSQMNAYLSSFASTGKELAPAQQYMLTSKIDNDHKFYAFTIDGDNTPANYVIYFDKLIRVNPHDTYESTRHIYIPGSSLRAVQKHFQDAVRQIPGFVRPDDPVQKKLQSRRDSKKRKKTQQTRTPEELEKLAVDQAVEKMLADAAAAQARAEGKQPPKKKRRTGPYIATTTQMEAKIKAQAEARVAEILKAQKQAAEAAAAAAAATTLSSSSSTSSSSLSASASEELIPPLSSSSFHPLQAHDTKTSAPSAISTWPLSGGKHPVVHVQPPPDKRGSKIYTTGPRANAGSINPYTQHQHQQQQKQQQQSEDYIRSLYSGKGKGKGIGKYQFAITQPLSAGAESEVEDESEADEYVVEMSQVPHVPNAPIADPMEVETCSNVLVYYLQGMLTEKPSEHDIMSALRLLHRTVCGEVRLNTSLLNDWMFATYTETLKRIERESKSEHKSSSSSSSSSGEFMNNSSTSAPTSPVLSSSAPLLSEYSSLNASNSILSPPQISLDPSSSVGSLSSTRVAGNKRKSPHTRREDDDEDAEENAVLDAHGGEETPSEASPPEVTAAFDLVSLSQNNSPEVSNLKRALPRTPRTPRTPQATPLSPTPLSLVI